MHIFMNVPYFGLGITVASFLVLYFRYWCYILCCRRRPLATRAFCPLAWMKPFFEAASTSILIFCCFSPNWLEIDVGISVGFTFFNSFIGFHRRSLRPCRFSSSPFIFFVCWSSRSLIFIHLYVFLLGEKNVPRKSSTDFSRFGTLLAHIRAWCLFSFFGHYCDTAVIFSQTIDLLMFWVVSGLLGFRHVTCHL